MILAEAPRLYPVFTHHAKELQAAARYLMQRMERFAAGCGIPDERFYRMMERHRLVIQTMAEMNSAREPYVYLNQEERDLVRRVNTWLKDHPEHRTA